VLGFSNVWREDRGKFSKIIQTGMWRRLLVIGKRRRREAGTTH
jgi:hypothetical protein